MKYALFDNSIVQGFSQGSPYPGENSPWIAYASDGRWTIEPQSARKWVDDVNILFDEILFNENKRHADRINEISVAKSIFNRPKSIELSVSNSVTPTGGINPLLRDQP